MLCCPISTSSSINTSIMQSLLLRRQGYRKDNHLTSIETTQNHPHRLPMAPLTSIIFFRPYPAAIAQNSQERRSLDLFSFVFSLGTSEENHNHHPIMLPLVSIYTLSKGAGSLNSRSTFWPESSCELSPCRPNRAPRSNLGAFSSLTFRMWTFWRG